MIIGRLVIVIIISTTILFILFEYCTEHVTPGLHYVMFTFPY